MKEKWNYNFCKKAYGKKDYDFNYCYSKCSKISCPSVSNILHGKIFKLPIIKQIYNVFSYIKDYVEDKKLEKDYISETETEFTKFIWGIKSWDDLSGADANLYTMNDIDLIYLKNEDKYILGIETIYLFNDKESTLKYLKIMLQAFTQYMERNNLKTTSTLSIIDIFTSGYNIKTHFDTIEDCYNTFKLLVDGYCSQNEHREDE